MWEDIKIRVLGRPLLDMKFWLLIDIILLCIPCKPAAFTLAFLSSLSLYIGVGAVSSGVGGLAFIGIFDMVIDGHTMVGLGWEVGDE